MRDPLVQALRQPDSLAQASARDWSLRVAEARSAGLLAELAARTAAVPAPPEARSLLDAALHQQQQQRRFMLREINHLAAALAPVGLPWLLLKGGAYLALDLPFARQRSHGDLDLLVAREHLPRFEGALLAGGWLGDMRQDAHDQRFYREWSHEVPPVTHVRRGSTVDLHHALAPPLGRYPVDTAQLLARAQPLPGLALGHTLAAEDLPLHSALHLEVSGEFHRALRDLLDIERLLRHFETQAPGFEARVAQRAEQLGLSLPWALALQQRERLWGTAPQRPVQVSVPQGLGLALRRPLFNAAIGSPHPRDASLRRSVAQGVLYLRAHRLRLPLRLLLPHLWHKFMKRWRAQHAPAAARLEG